MAPSTNLACQATTINKMVLKNRFVMSAAADNLDKDHIHQLARFNHLSAGGIGLIITGGMRFNKIGDVSEIVNVVHRNDSKIAIQIVTEPGPGITMGIDPCQDAIAISVLSETNPFFNTITKYSKHHAATDAELQKIIHTYAEAAKKVKAIHADAIQIHGAHQSFLSQSLSPLTNLRLDKWGGSLENRTRIHREIYQAVRAAVGSDFPVIIKLGVEDALPGGLKFIEGKVAAKMLAECGYDAIEISQGLQDITSAFRYGNWHGTPMKNHIYKTSDEAYFRNWCREIKNSITKPIILSGGLRSRELIEDIIQNNDADLVGLCRPFIREANLIKRWANGDQQKARCISCNKCITELLLQGLPLECYLDRVCIHN